MELITERRMQLASALLQDTDLKLTEISAKVGYLSEASFTRRFKRFYRLAPGEMRKNLRSRDDESRPEAQVRAINSAATQFEHGARAQNGMTSIN
jgi:AraC-like DNA-binding protein